MTSCRVVLESVNFGCIVSSTCQHFNYNQGSNELAQNSANRAQPWVSRKDVAMVTLIPVHHDVTRGGIFELAMYMVPTFPD